MTSVSNTLRPKWRDVSQEDFRSIYQSLDSLQDLAALWGVPASQLSYHAYVADKSHSYETFEIPRRNGRTRKLEAPHRALKYLQRILHESMARIYQPHGAVHGFCEGRSIKTNAERHLNRRYVLTIDILDYFPSISRQRISGRLRKAPYSLDSKVADIIASLATNSLGRLPQGSPSSPILSNMIAAELDTDLAKFSASKYCTYTRYADDITISTRRSAISPDVARYPSARGTGQVVLGDGLRRIIEQHSFVVNDRKSRLQSYWTRQLCTGLVVNGESVSVPRKYVRGLRAQIDRWKKKGWQAAAVSLAEQTGKQRLETREQFANHIRGRLDYLAWIRSPEDEVYLNLVERVASIPDGH